MAPSRRTLPGHPFVSAVLLVAVLLSGCLSANPGGSLGNAHDDEVGRTDLLFDPALAAWAEQVPDGITWFAAPQELRLGQAFRFTSDGIWDLAPERVLVVAYQTDMGYEILPQGPDMALDAVMWGRDFYGETDRFGSSVAGCPMEWPLWDGKTWLCDEQPVNVTMEGTPPAASDDHQMAFRMTWSDKWETRSWVYDPDVGFITDWERRSDDLGVFETLRFVAAEEATAGWRFTTAGYGGVGSSAPDLPLHLPLGETESIHAEPGQELLFVGLGDTGSQLRLRPDSAPDQEFLCEGKGLWEWCIQRSPYTNTDWHVVGMHPEGTWVGTEFVSVTWEEVPLGSW